MRRLLTLLLLALLPLALADTCGRINDAYNACQLESMCSQCISTSGCEFNLVDSTCATATNASTATSYCSSSDSVCATCSVSASNPTCTGEDGVCLCPSLCDVVDSSSASGCTSSSQNFSMMYVAVAFGALSIMLLLYMQRKCAERRVEQRLGLVRRELEARRQQRHREREMLRARRPQLALELAAWRDHVELHKPQMSNVELETCYYLMLQDKKGEVGELLSDDELKASGIGAVSSPLAGDAADVATPRFNGQSDDGHTASPYFAMREELPSDTTTDDSASSDGESERASGADVAIDVVAEDQPAASK